jgi:hypothetical protein
MGFPPGLHFNIEMAESLARGQNSLAAAHLVKPISHITFDNPQAPVPMWFNQLKY